MPEELSDEALKIIAERFKALSEPARLRLLICLKAGEKTVGELIGETGMSQPNASRHLARLTAAGIISRRRAGANAIYRIVDMGVFKICDNVCASLRKDAEKRGKALGS